MSSSREVRFDNPLPEYFTCCIYGPLRSGKTEILGTFPYPRILADSLEKGYETIRTIPRDKLWDPDFTPEVRLIRSIKDVHEELALAKVDFMQGRIKTLCFDSITFLAKMMELKFRVDFAAEISRNKYFVYSKLFEQISIWQQKAHEIGCNVVWSAVDNVEDSGKGGVMLSGQAKTSIPGAVDLLLHTEIIARPAQNGQPNGEMAYAARSRPTPQFPAGGRGVFGYLPDPIYDPSYRGIMDALVAALNPPEEEASVEELAPEPVAAQPTKPVKLKTVGKK